MKFQRRALISLNNLFVWLIVCSLIACIPIKPATFRNLPGAKVIFRENQLKYLTSLRWTNPQKIMVEEYTFSTMNLWVGDPITNQLTLLLPGDKQRRGVNAVISPDGHYLAYVVCSWASCSGVQISEFSPTFESKRFIGFAGAWALAWSPDSSRLALLKEAGDDDQIYFYTISTDQLELVYTFPREERRYNLYVNTDNMAWSPNGKYLAFSLGQAESDVRRSDIYLFSITESRLIPVNLDPNRHEGYPSWSPQGILMYVSASKGLSVIGDGRLVLYNPERNCTKTLTLVQDIVSPQWSPDGKEVAFIADDVDDQPQIFLLPVSSLGIDVTNLDAICSPAPGK